jgi:FkbM family methyltransferase
MILKKLSEILRNLARLSYWLSSKLYERPDQQSVKVWFRDKGDKTLRLNYNLDESSLVFDLGGYEGQWASDIFAMYGCSIHIFEPVEDFANKIEHRFAKNKHIIIHKFGLSNKSNTAKISVSDDASSIFKPGLDSQYIKLVKAIDFLKEQDIQHIDLIKINIEGGEYDLLDHLLETGFISKITNIQVQFHDFVPDAASRMDSIQQQLRQTHSLTYQYLFVWENWRLTEDRKNR